MEKLQDLMRLQGISSLKALSKQSGVSEKSIWRLRKGQLPQMQVGTLVKLANALNVSLDQFVAALSELPVSITLPAVDSQAEIPHVEDISPAEEQSEDVTLLESEEQSEVESAEQSAVESPELSNPSDAQSDLHQEYQRLQQKIAQQREMLLQEFQQSSLQTLEPWLLQWSAAAYAASQNPQVPATNLLPLVRPVEMLLLQWGIEAIAQVGTEMTFDPQSHQLMEGMANPGDRVRVRYAGYRQGDRVLYRAKVSPMATGQGIGDG
ncbi:MAG: helix-turn-helix domain-containing protein [Synechococcales bacterium]|nr:helix-turn-helix domain-containing protein [Synechococcales bacterium]